MNNREKAEYILWFFIACGLAFGLSALYFSGMNMQNNYQTSEITVAETVIGELNGLLFVGGYLMTMTRMFAMGILFGYIFTRKILDVKNKEQENDNND